MASQAHPAESLPLPPWTTIAFSGHRTLDEPEQIAGAIARALAELAKHRPQIAAVASAASGADTLFAEAALRAKLPLTVVLPFPRERFAKDFEGDPESWRRAQAVIGAATFVDEVGRTDGDESAYMEAAVRTIDAADLLLAVWDGLPGKGAGGTADAVAYARALGKPVVIIDAKTGAFDVAQLASLGDAAPNAERLTPADIANPLAVVERLYDRANQKALEHGPRSRRIVLWYVCLHLIASAALVAKMGFRIDAKSEAAGLLLSAFELGVLLLGTVWLVRWHHKRHQAWVSQRAVAEICRSFVNTWQIRRRTPGHPPKPPPLAFESLFSTLRLLRHLDRGPMPTLDEARDAYRERRLRHQLQYFTSQRDHARRWIRRLRLLVLSATLLAVFSTLTSVWLSLQANEHREAAASQPAIANSAHVDAEHAKEALEVISALAPLIGAAIGTIILTHEYARRAERYAELVDLLEKLQTRLNASRTWDGLARIATQVEEELLQEVLEWQAFTRVTAHLH